LFAWWQRYCAFSSFAVEAGGEDVAAVSVGAGEDDAVGGATLAVSVLGALIAGVDGAEATDDSVLALGAVEVLAACVFSGAIVSAFTEVEVVEVVAPGAGAAVARLGFVAVLLVDEADTTFSSDLGELLLLRLATGAGSGDASATLVDASCGLVAAAGATSAGPEVLGTVPESTLLAVCAAGAGTLISLSLTLWSNSSAPAITEAVMTPKAIPKWFMGSPVVHSM
jgi:hypothetical protein